MVQPSLEVAFHPWGTIAQIFFGKEKAADDSGL
jgi:hypothetical protein